MRRDDRTGRVLGRDARRRNAQPRVEGLEGRLLLYATTGGAWQHPSTITYSFVPDGTNVAGFGSNLFSAFNAKWSTATWEAAFQKAAATWEQAANINLVQVSDNGTPMSGGIFQQGDPGMGDIRISGLTSAALGTGMLAYTLLPPPINGGSEAGDIIVNTSQSWQINSDYDLLTVAIHEFGHALGMDHSAIGSADMYAAYNGIKQSLTPDDTAGIDSIYGPRQPDWFMANFNNSTAANAFNLTPYLDSQGRVAAQGLDIQTLRTSEWFKVTVPANTNGTLVVTMQSTNISALDPGVGIEDSTGHFLTYAFPPGLGYNGGTAVARITGVTPGQVYYIIAGASVGLAAGTGDYGLLVNLGSSPQYPIPLTTYPTLIGLGSGGGAADAAGHGEGNDKGNGHGHGHDHDDGPDWLKAFDGDALMIPDGSSSDAAVAGGTAAPLLLIAPTDSGDGSDSTPGPAPAGPRWFARTSKGSTTTASSN